jgi:hypothetical protein
MNIEMLKQLNTGARVEIGAECINFDFRVEFGEIYPHNLPGKVIRLIESAPEIERRGNDLFGKDGRRVLWSARAEHWSAEETERHKEFFDSERQA